MYSRDFLKRKAGINEDPAFIKEWEDRIYKAEKKLATKTLNGEQITFLDIISTISAWAKPYELEDFKINLPLP